MKKGFIREHFDSKTGKAYPDADPRGPTIQGLVIMQYAGTMISIQGSVARAPIEPGAMPIGPVGTRILNNSLLYSGSTCMSLSGTPEATIAYNDISYGQHEGMGIQQAHNSIFEHNIVSFHNPNKLGNFPAGIKIFNQSLNFIVRNNYCYGNKANAIWYDVGHREGVVVNNYFNNNFNCLKTEISHRIYFTGNVADNSPLWIVNVCSNMVYNNTFIDSKLTIMRNNRGQNPDSRASFNHNATGPGNKGYHGQEIINNVFAFSGAQRESFAFSGTQKKESILGIDDTNESDTEFVVRMIAHNLFSGKTVSFAKVNSVGLKLGTAKSPLVYATLKDFQSGFMDYVKDCVQMDKSPEELFNNPSIGDYRLKNVDGAPKGESIPMFIAAQLGWKPVACGIGAFAQSP